MDPHFVSGSETSMLPIVLLLNFRHFLLVSVYAISVRLAQINRFTEHGISLFSAKPRRQFTGHSSSLRY